MEVNQNKSTRQKENCTYNVASIDGISRSFLDRLLYLEYIYSYQLSSNVGIFIYLPEGLFVEFDENRNTDSEIETKFFNMFNCNTVVRNMKKDLNLQCSSVKINNLGTNVNVVNVNEKLPISILTSVTRPDEIVTEIFGYYTSNNQLDHLGLFFQKWVGLLGLTSNPFSYNSFLRKVYEKQNSKLKKTTNLYKANMIICSYRPTQKDIFKNIKSPEEREYTVEQVEGNKIVVTSEVEVPMRFFVVEEAYLCLGVFPKSITSLGDYDRSSNEIKKYSVTWNTDMIYTSYDIIYQTQVISDMYFKEVGLIRNTL